jgi:NADH-quinone oxidoreductase subunit D
VQQVVAGIGPAAIDRADLLLDIGAHHPSTHGSLRLALTLDGEGRDAVVTAAEPLVGHLHRGAEKLFEARDYRAVTMLANRHDWLSAFANEIGVVTAVERMLGLEVPARATWLRTLLVELNRVLAHLLFLAAVGPALDPDLVATRERVQALLEAASGGRVHFMFSRVGGVKEELPAGWTAQARAVLAAVRTPQVPPRLAGLGVLDRDLVGPYGLSGPLARASGAPLDLRRDAPYLAYGQLDVPLVVQEAGDCAARYAQLAAEVAVSVALAGQCLEALETVTGPVNVRLPKVVKAPEGAVYVRTENPLGVMGYYLVSRGERTPWRLHMRTASFNNVQVLRALLPGTRVEDLATVLASVFFVVGDIDK